MQYSGLESFYHECAIFLSLWRLLVLVNVFSNACRNNYICSTYAAQMMVEKKTGLIVNVSSFGGQRYLFNVAYGIGKAAVSHS